MDFKSYIANRREAVDAALERYLPSANTAPSTLHKAMRHSMFAGGKRLRPILTLAADEACGGDNGEAALALAGAVEMIHTYSLIHDDLPCMDDDDFRRGQPTCHKVYGEDVAVLAGDALQSLAFEMLTHYPGAGSLTTCDALRELATTAGSLKLIAGQVMDMEGEGKDLSFEQLRAIHLGKTSALLTTSIRFGGFSAGTSPEKLDALTTFGTNLGLAFQVIDDILDVTATSEALGKTAGKDADVGKATYPAILGLDASREEAKKLTAQAIAALTPFGTDAHRLREIASYMLEREY